MDPVLEKLLNNVDPDPDPDHKHCYNVVLYFSKDKKKKD